MINRILIWIALAFSAVALGIAIQHGSVPSATPAHRLGASNQCFVNDPTTQGLLGFPTLTSAVTTAVQSTIQVSSTAAFAQCVGRTFQVRIDNEVLVVTGAVGLTLSVIRGADNSIPTIHYVGAMVSGVITAGGLSALNPFAALDGGAGNLLTLFDGGTYGWQSPIPLPGNVLAVYPIDGVSDDWATLMQVTLPAAIAAGQWVELMPGPAGQQWIIGSRQTVPNHARIAINHSAVVHSTLTPNGGRSYAFAAYPTYGAQAQIVGGVTAAGATSITVPFAVAAGTWVQLTPGNSAVYANFGLQRQVISSVSNDTNYTLTFSEPLSRPFPSGAYATAMTTEPSDITVQGNSALIYGSGDGCVDMDGGDNMHFYGIYCAVDSGSTNSDISFLFDTSAVDSSFEDCTAVVANTTDQGFRLAGTERSAIIGCTSTGGAISFMVNDSVSSRIEHVFAANAGTGIYFTVDGTINPPYSGSLNCYVNDAVVDNMTASAYSEAVVGAVYGQKVSNVLSDKACTVNPSACSALQSSNGTEFDNITLNGPIDQNGSAGVLLSGNNASIRNLTITGFTYGIFNSSTGTTIAHNVSINNNGYAGIYPQTGSLVVDTAIIQNGVYGVRQSGGDLSLYRSTIANNSNAGINVFGGLVEIDHTSLSSNGNYDIVSAASLHVGQQCAYSVTSGTGFSRGSVTLNGTTTVAVGYPAITALDRVHLAMTAAGGTIGQPVVTVTVGTGFSVKSTVALDTSTYQYSIE